LHIDSQEVVRIGQGARRVEIDGTGTGGAYALQSDEAGRVIVASGNSIQLGFYGQSGSLRQTITGQTGQQGTDQVLLDLLDALEDLGLITHTVT